MDIKYIADLAKVMAQVTINSNILCLEQCLLTNIEQYMPVQGGRHVLKWVHIILIAKSRENFDLESPKAVFHIHSELLTTRLNQFLFEIKQMNTTF